jgi:hypothetical protein
LEHDVPINVRARQSRDNNCANRKKAHENLKFVEPALTPDPEAAAGKLVEIASTIELTRCQPGPVSVSPKLPAFPRIRL